MVFAEGIGKGIKKAPIIGDFGLLLIGTRAYSKRRIRKKH